LNATVVKVGGSLSLYPEKLRTLCLKISEISKEQKLIVVPGGGEFADVVRCLDKSFHLSCSTSHGMAILGMDQYGMLLSDLMPGSITTHKLEEINNYFDLNKLPIFLPSHLLLREDSLENSWAVTSDSIAVYIAGRLQVTKVLLVTDVDGIYNSDPKTFSEAKLINNISVSELLAINKRTSVDKALPKLLLKTSIDCFVVNGLFPERIKLVLAGQDSIYTLIKG
jgi:5-(aminomethyl)-3-furanmethanol phosphate kinase